MNLMAVVKDSRHGLKSIFTRDNVAHVPRENETILYHNKEYMVVQVIWHYDENCVFVYCREE
jgi:hypothetical protein